MHPGRQINRGERLVRLRDVPDLIPGPKPGKKTSLDALNRWVIKGIAGVRLEILRIGGTRFTSQEAIDRFNEAVTAAKDRRSQPATSSATSRAAAARAEAELKLLGA